MSEQSPSGEQREQSTPGAGASGTAPAPASLVQPKRSEAPAAPAKRYRARSAFKAKVGPHGTLAYEKGDLIDAAPGKYLHERGAPVEPVR